MNTASQQVSFDTPTNVRCTKEFVQELSESADLFIQIKQQSQFDRPTKTYGVIHL